MSHKGRQANKNFAPAELGYAVLVLAQSPPADASPGVRPEQAQPGPQRQRVSLLLFDTAHSTKPAALTPLTCLRRIVPETQQDLLQGPGHLLRHGNHTHRPRPQLSKTGDCKSSRTEGLGTSTKFPPVTLPMSPTYNYGETPTPHPQRIIPGTSVNKGGGQGQKRPTIFSQAHQHRRQQWPPWAPTYKPW